MSNMFVSIHNYGYIPTIGMDGPIVNPITIPKKMVVELVQSNLTVYQHSELHPNMKVLLNINNIDEKKFNKIDLHLPANNDIKNVNTLNFNDNKSLENENVNSNEDEIEKLNESKEESSNDEVNENKTSEDKINMNPESVINELSTKTENSTDEVINSNEDETEELNETKSESSNDEVNENKTETSTNEISENKNAVNKSSKKHKNK